MGNSGWKKLKPVIIFIQLTVSIASLVTNWLLFADINNVLPGLVFGPFPLEFRHTVLGFCVVSSILNVLELWFLWTELFRRRSNCYISGNASSALIIWLDDIPKAVFMLYITSCHDRAISLVEIVRSILLLVTAIIRLAAFSIRECYRKRRESEGLPTREDLMKRNRPCRCCIYGSITVGVFIKIITFGILFFFTHLTTYDGRLAFKHPRGIMHAEPDVAKYMPNVSIFAQIKVRNESWGWFEVVPLNNVVLHKRCTSKLSLNMTNNRVETNCGSNSSFVRASAISPLRASDTPIELNVRFLFVEPSKKLLLGNIEYIKSATSKLPTDAQVSLEYFCAGNKASKDAIGLLMGLIKKEEFEYKGSKVFGDNKRTVSKVSYCWRTGKFECHMRGLPGPMSVSEFSE